ncbi:hypothetical protein MPSEU_000348500 [Mayamaea pseudoterrestris]|nr:hypothetical protein MPSEU_000348500 [Mayamaea pseudoterrestris]
MTLRRTLFDASVPDVKEATHGRFQSTTKSTSRSVPVMDSLAFVGLSTSKSKSQPLTAASVLEQLDNLGMIKIPSKQGCSYPTKTFVQKDPVVMDSLGATGEQNAQRTSRQSTNHTGYQNELPNRKHTRRQLEERRKKTMAKKSIRHGPSTRLASHKDAGGILGALAFEDNAGRKNVPVKQRNASASTLTRNIEQPFQGQPNNTKSAIALAAVRSPMCSPSYEPLKKRTNQQPTPTLKQKLMGGSQLSDPSVSLDILMTISPMQCHESKNHSSPNRPIQHTQSMDMNSVLSLIFAASNHSSATLEEDGIVVAAARECRSQSSRDSIGSVKASGETSTTKRVAPDKDRRGLAFPKSLVQSKSVRVDGKAMHAPTTNKVATRVPEHASPDPVIDPGFLKRLARADASMRILEMEILAGDTVSLSTCTLTQALLWEEDDADSIMAVASVTLSMQVPQGTSEKPCRVLPIATGTASVEAMDTNALYHKDIATETASKNEPQSRPGHDHQATGVVDCPIPIPGNHDVSVAIPAQTQRRTDKAPSTTRPSRCRRPIGSCHPASADSMSGIDVGGSRHLADPPVRLSFLSRKTTLDASTEDACQPKHSTSPFSRPRRNRKPTDYYKPEAPKDKTFIENSCTKAEKTHGLPPSRDRSLKLAASIESKELECHIKAQLAGGGHSKPAPFIASDEKEEIEANGWTRTQLRQLNEAQQTTNPISLHFWDDIAEQVSGKDPSECCAQWMAMYPTPTITKRRATKRDVVVQPANANTFVSLFNATPWRGKEIAGHLPDNIDLGSAVKLEKEIFEAYDGCNGCSWKPPDGMQKYVTDMARAVRRRQPAKKGNVIAKELEQNKNVRERIDVDGINMNVCMTPGGTLNFQCSRDDNSDEDFDEYYGVSDDM